MSSKKLASLLIRISANGADARAALMDVSEHLADLGKKAEKVGKKLTKTLTVPLTAIAAASVKLADTQVQAEAKLLTALQGREAVQQRLIKQAGELQSRTTLGDEAIIEQQAFLAALGLTESQIGDTINAAVQLSAALSISLESAVRNLAKTYGGMTGELGESIPALKELTKEQLMAGEAISFVNENYKGFAETAASTGMGPLVQLKNTLGDLAEQIGVIVLPALQTLAKWMKSLVEWFQNFPAWAQKTIVIIGALAAAIGPFLITVGKLAGIIGKYPTLIKAMANAFVLLKGPIGIAVAALAAVAVALSLVKDRHASLQRAYMDEHQRALAERKDAIRENMLSQYASATDKEIADAIEYYQGVVNDDANRYISAHGGSIPDRLKDELDVTTEYVRVLKELQSERAKIKALTDQMTDTLTPEESYEKVSGIFSDAFNPRNALGYSAPGLGVEGDAGRYESFLFGLETFKNQFEQAEEDVESIAESSVNIAGILQNAFEGIASGISNAVTALVEGTNFDPIAAFIELLAESLEQLGKALIAYAGAQLTAQLALKSMQWPVALAAGTAAVAAGAALKAAMKKRLEVPALASGGLAYGPTLAVVGDNRGASHDPEVIAPLSKLRQYMGAPSLELVGDVEFRVDGDGLRAVLNRANTRLKYR